MDRKEAIEIVRKNYPHVGFSGSEFETALRKLVPEFNEQPDPRHSLIEFIKWSCDRGCITPEQRKNVDFWLAYLEKQKEPLTPEENMNHPLYLEGFDVGKKVGEVLKEQQPAEWNDADMREARQNLITCCRDWERGENTTLLPIVATRARYFLEHLVEPQKPAEWSKEDESNLQSCIAKIEIDMQHWDKHGKTMVDGDIKLIDWLKSLRPQPHWKPSEEQIGALERAIVKTHTVDDIGILAELRDNLKKL